MSICVTCFTIFYYNRCLKIYYSYTLLYDLRRQRPPLYDIRYTILQISHVHTIWEKELSRQKAEVLEAISSFHDGTWICSDGALSFSITTDVAAGITAKRRSVPYTTSSSLLSSSSTNPIRMMETFSWNVQNPTLTNDESCCAAVRTVPWGQSVDVDSVDSSYSLDGMCTLPASSSTLLPPSVISGWDPTHCVFFMEKNLALSNHERIRIFILYEHDGSMSSSQPTGAGPVCCKLARVVLCQEHRKEETTYASSLSTEPNHILEPVSLLTLSLGPWLGDVVVRDRPITPHSADDGFAEWMLGVSKVAMKFDYDLDSTIKKYLEHGRSLGVSVHPQVPLFSRGIMNEKGMSRRIQPRERILYIDYDSGADAAFLIGSIYIKVRLNNILSILKQ